MKSLILPLIIGVLFFTGCSQDFSSIENQVEIDIQKRSNFECVKKVDCEDDYIFPIKGPGSYYCFIAKFDPTMTLEEIYCLKQAYFTCFPLLRKAIFQTTNPYNETWCYPTGYPLETISTTMDDDPRVDDGG